MTIEIITGFNALLHPQRQQHEQLAKQLDHLLPLIYQATSSESQHAKPAERQAQFALSENIFQAAQALQASLHTVLLHYQAALDASGSR